MKLFLALALRNVFRNRIRTVVALAAIASGCAALIVNGGVIYSIFRELREDAIHGRHGHIQIYRWGYTDHHLGQPWLYLIPRDETERIVRLVREIPGVERVTRVREFAGVIDAGYRTVAFVGIGVEPEQDAEFSRHTTLRRGLPLAADDPFGMVCGLGLAEKIAVEPGKTVTLMAYTTGGVPNRIDIRLRGVFEGGMKAYDDWTLRLPLEAVERLLQDDRTEKIVLLLDRTESVPAVSARLDALFRREHLALETRTWQDLALFHNQTVSLFSRELDVIEIIVATIVILGIANTIGMAIVERRVELATLRALGLGRRAVVTLLMTEALLMGLLGAVLGVALGAALARLITAIGISFPSPPGSTRPFVGGVELVPHVVALSFFVSAGATLAAAVLPVWKAARRPIAETLRGA